MSERTLQGHQHCRSCGVARAVCVLTGSRGWAASPHSGRCDTPTLFAPWGILRMDILAIARLDVPSCPMIVKYSNTLRPPVTPPGATALSARCPAARRLKSCSRDLCVPGPPVATPHTATACGSADSPAAARLTANGACPTGAVSQQPKRPWN